MRMCCITKSIETAVGLKLTGADCVIANDQKTVNESVQDVINEGDVGILVIDDDIYSLIAQDLIEKIQLKKLPLMVRI